MVYGSSSRANLPYRGEGQGGVAGVLRKRGTEVYRTLNKKSSMPAEGSMQG